jgi:hypothetical protein
LFCHASEPQKWNPLLLETLQVMLPAHRLLSFVKWSSSNADQRGKTFPIDLKAEPILAQLALTSTV